MTPEIGTNLSAAASDINDLMLHWHERAQNSPAGEAEIIKRMLEQATSKLGPLFANISELIDRAAPKRESAVVHRLERPRPVAHSDPLRRNTARGLASLLEDARRAVEAAAISVAPMADCADDRDYEALEGAIEAAGLCVVESVGDAGPGALQLIWKSSGNQLTEPDDNDAALQSKNAARYRWWRSNMFLLSPESGDVEDLAKESGINIACRGQPELLDLIADHFVQQQALHDV